MIKAWSDAAWEDFEYWLKQDKKTLNRILRLLKDIDRNGYEGIGKPERISGDLSAYWSRLSRNSKCDKYVKTTVLRLRMRWFFLYNNKNMNQPGLLSLSLAYAAETESSAVQHAWRSIAEYGAALCGVVS